MRLSTKLAIDRLLGTIIVDALILLGSLRGQKRPADPIRPANIFVLKLLGLGSIIQATPLIAALQRLHPNARIIFVTKQGNEQLTDRFPGISRTLTVSDDGIARLLWSVARLLCVFHRTRETCFINLEAHSKIGAILTMLSRSRWKVGFFRNPRDLRLRAMFDRLVYFNQSAPISEVYLQLGRTLGADNLSPPLSEIKGIADDERDAERFLNSVGLPRAGTRLVLVNPNASELRLERRWPAAHFARTIDALARADPDLYFIFVGSQGELAHVETIVAQIPAGVRARVFNGAGHVSLGGLIALIRRASLLITNDSGPMHIALSLATPTVGLFGPVDPDHYASTNTSGTSIFLYHRIYCSPCVHHFEEAPCRGDNICMKQISVAEVLEAARTLLRDEDAPRAVHRQISYMDQGRPIGVIGALK